MTYSSEFDAQVVHQFAIVVVVIFAEEHLLSEEQLIGRHFTGEEDTNALVVKGVDQCYEPTALGFLG